MYSVLPGIERRGILVINDDKVQFNYRRWIVGACRYASARQWSVDVVPREESNPAVVAEALRKLNPVGCIVGAYTGCKEFPPEFFGGIKVCYFDPPGEKPPWPGAAAVVSDNRAIAEVAFRELSGTLPSSYAIVPSTTQRRWSIVRVKTFKALALAEGKPCRVFPVVKDEPGDIRTARLTPWVASLPAGCAVFAVSDLLASLVADAARATGRSIPRELTLIGVDGRYEGTEGEAPTVSTVNVDFERAGFLAAQSLDHPGIEVRKFGPLLVVRHESTGCRGRGVTAVRDAVAMIRREACDGLTASALAARFPGSRNLFERRFREAMGHSVLSEILHVRLEKVFAMLAMTDVPIGSIADFCGFGCDSDLRKLFRARTGTSMRQWRESRRGK